MNEEACINCKYWLLRIHGPEIASTGNCCRFPPMSRDLDRDGHPMASSWPSKTREYEWCGEYHKL